MKDPIADAARHSRLRQLREAALTRHVVSRLPASFHGRWTHRHWAHASLLASIVVLCAVLVPGMDHAFARTTNMPLASLALPLPQVSQPVPKANGQWAVVNLRKGESVNALLGSLGVSKAQIAQMMKSSDARASLAKLRPGSELSIDAPGNGLLRAIRFQRGGDKVELSMKDDGAVAAKVLPQDTEVRTVVLSGTVGDDLWKSANKAGLTRANVEEMTDEIFKYDIDFDSDLSPNDRFSVVVDQAWKNGELVTTSGVLAAAFTVDGELHTGFRYMRDGKPEYFSADGRSLKRPFIRMPIPYARLSSTFGNRMHPILGRMRMHKGVDYAASAGTPIMAAGDARVKFVGQQHGYGNVVELDHGRGQSTFYAHMSRFAHIRPGQHVDQGTVIGYVGSTGLATGPHLHYEFRVNGVYRNPLTVTMAPPAPLSGAMLVAFRQQTQRAMAKIRTVEKIIYPDMDHDTVVASTAPAQNKSARN
ncbi:MAG: M23 family metallopeptidase [Proteobacteria bacterium]|nr:M23 family metallopeptidase [Pseudomonadota bacterium]